ncbi:hypothetical protein KCU94_g16651, partial [Aureobasidium melanogenum]
AQPGASEVPMPPSRDESMTDGTTLESSGQATPLEFARQGKRPLINLVDDETDGVVDLTSEGALSIDDLETSSGAPMYQNFRSMAKKRRTH